MLERNPPHERRGRCIASGVLLVVGRRPVVLDRNPPQQCRGRAVLVGLEAAPVLRDLSRADELQPRRPGRAPLPQRVPRADLVREVLELGVLEPDKRRALHVLDIVVDAPDDRIHGSFVALVGPVGLDAVAVDACASVVAGSPSRLTMLDHAVACDAA